MGSYEVIIYKPAKRYLERCGRVLGRRLAARLDALGRDPYAHGKPLAGLGPLRSARVADLRLLPVPTSQTIFKPASPTRWGRCPHIHSRACSCWAGKNKKAQIPQKKTRIL